MQTTTSPGSSGTEPSDAISCTRSAMPALGGVGPAAVEQRFVLVDADADRGGRRGDDAQQQLGPTAADVEHAARVTGGERRQLSRRLVHWTAER